MRRLLVMLWCVAAPSLAFAQATVNVTAVDPSTNVRTSRVGDSTNNALRVNCVNGCGSATSDTDDGSVAGSQVGAIHLGFMQVWDGSVWRRLTIGTAGSASAQVFTVQGIASMTPILATLSGTNNLTNISGTISLPTGASTAAKQPALGTAGTASADVLTVQGITSMTPLVTTTEYAEDTVHVSGDKVQLAGCVQSQTGGALASDGDRTAVQCDDDGELRVQIDDAITVAGITNTVNVAVTNGSDVDANSHAVAVSGATAYADAVGEECHFTTTASTNAASCKTTASNFYGFEIYNPTTTVAYLRLYNLSTSPTCSSSTGYYRTIPIPPASAAGLVGGVVRISAFPTHRFSTGVAWCITGGASSTDNTNAGADIRGAVFAKE